MNCPNCEEPIRGALPSCPFCGARITRLETAVMKTSAVLVAKGERTAIFPSVKDVPEPLRTEVIRATSGHNSGTLVIADRRGKEEIERAARLELARQKAENERMRMNWRKVIPVFVSALIVGAGAWLALHR